MTDAKNNAHEVLSTLEIVGFEEHRGIVARRHPDLPDRFDELMPTLNEVAIIHVRFPGGKPFCVTVDGSTFSQVNQPLLNGILKKSEAIRDSRSKIPPAMPSDE